MFLITWTTNYSVLLVRNFRVHLQYFFVKLQCCRGNFAYSAKMASYERNLSRMILIANQIVYS